MTDKIRHNQQKLRKSKVCQDLQDRRFYTELIRQCEVVLPMVDECFGLCSIFPLHLSILPEVVDRIIFKQSHKYCFYYPYKNPIPFGKIYKYTPAWKQDRVELLEEIINYCKSKL